MKGLRYPRPGHPIAPSLLRDILNRPLPMSLFLARSEENRYRRFADLDANVWHHLPPTKIRELAVTVISQVTQGMLKMPPHVASLELPRLPANLELADLLLEPRTFHCLEKAGNPIANSSTCMPKIGDLLDIPGFGAKCVVDLLTSLEGAIAEAARRPQPKEPPKQQPLKTAAKHLRRLRSIQHIGPSDPRLGPLIHAIDPQGKTVEEIASRFEGISVDYPVARRIRLRIRKLRQCIARLKRAKLQTEILDILSARTTKRNRDILVFRFGLNCDPAKTLEDVGKEFGMTRERVRQICSAAVTRVGPTPPFAPTLDKALRLASDRLPALVDDVEQQISTSILAEGEIALDDLASIAEILGRTVPWKVFEFSGLRLASGHDITNELQSLARACLRTVTKYGLSTIADLQAAATTVKGTTSEVLVRIIGMRQDFRWLDDSKIWFTFATTWSNPRRPGTLIGVIRKVLAVAPRLHISELRRSLARHRRLSGFAPPRAVLLEICRQLPFCRVDEELVSAEPPLEVADLLSDIERAMVTIMRQHGPLMRWGDFRRICLESGIGAITFGIYCTNSSLFLRYSGAIYGVVGTEVQPGMIESIEEPRTRRNVIHDFGWTSDNQIWIEYRLSQSALTSGVLGIPSGMKPFLQGKFDAFTNDGAAIGSIVVSEGTAWGYGPLFRRRGGEEGDFLFAVFDMQLRKAILSMGDERGRSQGQQDATNGVAHEEMM